MIAPRGYLPFKPTFFDATSWLGQYHATSATSSLLDVAFFVVFQVDTLKRDNKNKKSDMGVKGLNWPLLFFYLSLSLRKSPNMLPEIYCNENFRIQNPSNSYTKMKSEKWLFKRINNKDFKILNF